LVEKRGEFDQNLESLRSMMPQKSWKKNNVSKNQGSDDLSFGLEIHASKEKRLRLKGTITINIDMFKKIYKCILCIH